MRVLQLHCSEFGYEVKKETPVAEQPASPKEQQLDDVLVCFICYEKGDEVSIEVDGGMNVENFRAAREAGANVIASGSFILKSEDVAKAVEALSSCLS